MVDLLIRGGMIVTPEGVVRADIAVEDGRIAAIAPDLPGAQGEIDAEGLTVFPGVIDDHVHFNEPGRTEWEGAASGSRAFAAGGGTTFFDMPLNSSPCTVGRTEFEAKRLAMEHASLTDFSLWGGLVPGNVDALEDLAQCGAIGFKAFMSDSGLPEFPRTDDLTLYEGMREAARLHLPVSVHAESEEITRELAKRYTRAGTVGIRDYLDSRPVLAETEAIQRAGLIARETGAKLHIVHISSGRGVAAALEARTLGADISIETCAHYLFFTEDDLLRLGAIAKCAPPLRDQAEQDSLWSHLMTGDVDIVASDHSPAPHSMKIGDNFFAIWGGIAGVQSTLPVMLESGHHQRGLPLEKIADLTAAAPARRFGIAHKGTIAIGQDADLTIVDLSAAYTLEPEGLFNRHQVSPYTGSKFRGAVRLTLLRGHTIFHDGRHTAAHRARLVRPTNYAATRTHT
jgi:allantoinase